MYDTEYARSLVVLSLSITATFIVRLSLLSLPDWQNISLSLKVQEANAKFDQDALQEMELAPVQRKIEARSAEDSFTGFVRTLYFADTFLRDSE